MRHSGRMSHTFSPRRRQYLLCYDISSNRRRRAVHRLLAQCSGSGQYSLFECPLSQAEYWQLLSRLHTLIDPATDHLLALHLDRREQILRLGVAQTQAPESWRFVV